MKTRNALTLIITFMILPALSACANLSALTNPFTGGRSGECTLKAPETLTLTGSTDAKMLACIRPKNLGAVTIVKVNSPGGDVDSAMKIGNLLAPLRAEFIVDKQCNSSCANYFLPIARKITLHANALILLHGSIDIGFAHKAIQDGVNAKVWDAVERQQAYAVKHNIHRGWLLYREQYGKSDIEQISYLDGQLAWMKKAKIVRMIAVEEHMLRSCLKNVEITPYLDTVIDRANADKRFKRRLVKQGVASSGTWQCIGPGSAHLPTPDFATLRAQAAQSFINP